MSREDIHKLLGGYATGTLTPEEQQALFEAALDDQELFDALAAEQPLRELLGDPAARAHLLAAIDDAPLPWYLRWKQLVPVAAVAAALVMVGIVELRPNLEPARKLPVAKLDFLKTQPQAPPLLPPPPEIATARPSFKPLKLPPPPSPAPPPIPSPMASVLPQRIVPMAAPPAPPPPVAFGSVNGAAVGQGNPFVAGSTPLAMTPRFVPIHGTVTDPAGAAVAAATVQLKSLDTGEVANATTNAQGEYTVPETPGHNYELTASAPGFQPRTVATVTPLYTTPEPLNLKLEVGSVAETVTVAGGGGGRGGRAAGVGGVSAGALAKRKDSPATFEAKPAAAPAQQAQAPMLQSDARQQQTIDGVSGGMALVQPSLQCVLLRRLPGGDYVAIANGATVPVGANLMLRITAADDGYVRVTRPTGRPVKAAAVRASQALEVALGKFSKPEQVELEVLFTPPAAEAKKTAQAATAARSRAVPAPQNPINTTVTFTVQ